MGDVSERRRNFVHNIPAARALRRPQTASEALFWEAVRDRRFKGLTFRRQHAVGRFVVDFYCHEHRLVVEVDGGIHAATDRAAADRQRQAELEAAGLRFFRVSAQEVEADLPSVLRSLCAHISMLPSPATGGSRERGRGRGPRPAEGRQEGRRRRSGRKRRA